MHNTTDGLSSAILSLEADDYTTLPLKLIYPDPNQDRTDFDTEEAIEHVNAIASSAGSLVEGKPYGIRQPIEVVLDPLEGSGQYRIIAGENRYRGASQAGLDEIPVIIRKNSNSQELSLDRLVENVVRRGLGLIDLANALQKRIDEGMEAQELARFLGKSKSWVSKYLKPLKVQEDVRELVESGLVSNIEHMDALNKIKGDDREKALKLVQNGRDPKDIVSKFSKPKKSKPTTKPIDEGFVVRFDLDKANRALNLLGVEGVCDSIAEAEEKLTSLLEEF